MKRTTRLRLAAVAALAVLLALGLWRYTVASQATMPVYQGKTARQWVDELYTTNSSAAFAALQVMGTNALPMVVQVLNDSTWKRTYEGFYRHLPDMVRRPLPPPNSYLAWQYAPFQNAPFLLLQSDLRTVFPDLVRLLRDKRNRARLQVMYVVQNRASSEYQEFTPILIECLKDTDYNIREGAAAALGRVGPGAKPAVPELTAALSDPVSSVRVEAAHALWKVDGQTPASYAAAKAVLHWETTANRVRPGQGAGVYLVEMTPEEPMALLLAELKGPDRLLRLNAADVLALRGPAAKEAVPELLDLLPKAQFGDAELYGPFLKALKSIDPEAAAKYLGESGPW